jgi:aminomethyltransferase
MIRRTPFHPRLEPLNETGLWMHWSGHLAATRYQGSAKAEYFAVRNAAAVFDTSPLYEYEISGTDAERYLAGVMARDVRTCAVGQAQYTCWCDDDGHVVEDGVLFRTAEDAYLLTAAEPNLADLLDHAGRLQVTIADRTEQTASLSVQGPRSRAVLSALAPQVADLAYFHHAPACIAGREVRISRTGYSGDLGYELWVDADGASDVWDALADAGRPHGLVPAGQEALLMARIEAGLLLIGVDFTSSRTAFTDHQRWSPFELGLGWMLRDVATTDRAFVGRAALRRELRDGTSRWATVGIVVDWRHWDELHREVGLIPPKDETPVVGEMLLYDDGGDRAGFTTSFMYSPVLQRHIAMARVRPAHARPGCTLHLELTLEHRYHTVRAEVTRLPLYRPARKTA